jgi:E3 ubiquitin-protein ligase DOA10
MQRISLKRRICYPAARLVRPHALAYCDSGEDQHHIIENILLTSLSKGALRVGFLALFDILIAVRSGSVSSGSMSQL